jgi:hypothetical protein
MPCGPKLREVLALADVGVGVAEVIDLQRLLEDAGHRFGRFGEKSIISSMT